MKNLKTRYFILKSYDEYDDEYSNIAIISIGSRTKNPLKDKLAKAAFEAKIRQAISNWFKGSRRLISITNDLPKVGDPDFEEYLPTIGFSDTLTFDVVFEYIDDEDFGDEQFTEYWYIDPIELI